MSHNYTPEQIKRLEVAQRHLERAAKILSSMPQVHDALLAEVYRLTDADTGRAVNNIGELLYYATHPSMEMD